MTYPGSQTTAILVMAFILAPAVPLQGRPLAPGSLPSTPRATRILFSIPAHVEGYGPSTLLTSGDLNRDGRDDLIWRDEKDQLITYLAVGGGRFAPAGQILLDRPFGSIAIVDADHDGLSDIAYHTQSSIGVLKGRGDGTFTDIGIHIEGPGPEFWMIAGDFDGDGCREVAGLDNRSIHFESGTVPLPIPIVNAGALERGGYQIRITTGDLDGDRDDDLIISLSENLLAPTYEVHWLLVFASVPGKRFSLASKLKRDHLAEIIRAGDFDRDGRLELITSTYKGITLNHGSGDGSFSTARAFWADSPIVELRGRGPR